MAYKFYSRSNAKLGDPSPGTQHTGCTFTPESHLVDLPEPPFPNLLYIDCSLSPDQRLLIKESISATSSVKDDIRSRQELLRKAIKQLEGQETELDCYIRNHEALLTRTAVGHLPLDVLGRIFVFALADAELQFAPKSYSTWDWGIPNWRARVPFIASQVCQSWRKAAFRQPDLWTCISLQFSNKWVRKDSSVEKLLSLALQRSQQRSLSVTIDAPEDQANLKAWLNPSDGWPWSVLKDHAERITRLTINPPYHLFCWSDTKGQIKFPATALCIRDSQIYGRSNEQRSRQTEIISAPPSIRELATYGMVDLSRFTFSFKGISQLQINIVAGNLSGIYTVLQESSLIQDLHWEFNENYCEEFMILQDPIVTGVRRFIVSGHVWSGARSERVKVELTKLRFPQLEHLSGIEIVTFCNHLDSLPLCALTTLSLVFKTRTALSGSEKEELPFYKQIQNLLGILSHATLDLQTFSLDHGGPWKPKDWLGHPSFHGGEPPEDRNDIKRGYTIFIESMIKERIQSFTNLQKLALDHLPLSLSEQLLTMVYHKATKTLKEVTFKFDGHQDLAKDFGNKITLVCRDTGLKAMVNYNKN